MGAAGRETRPRPEGATDVAWQGKVLAKPASLISEHTVLQDFENIKKEWIYYFGLLSLQL